MPSDPNHPEKIEHLYEFNVPAGQKPDRIDAFITRSIEHATRTRVQKAIERGAVLVNDKPTRANYRIRPGDKIQVTVYKQPPLQLVPENIPIKVIYEDEHLIVIDKAAGMAVHPGFGNRYGTLVNAMLWHVGYRDPIDVLKRRESWGTEDEEGEEIEEVGDGDQEDDEEVAVLDELGPGDEDLMMSPQIRPGIVHRLDKDTSGLIVIGKDYRTTLYLSRQFAARTVSRQYVALTWGVIKDDHRLIEQNIDRSSRDRRLMTVVARGGKYAATEVNVVERYDCATLITCTLRTGRTHQIRVHLSSIQHPILGDPDYGGRESALNGVHHLYRLTAKRALNVIHRQALHARTLGFTHPVTHSPMQFTSDLPSDLLAAVHELRPSDAPGDLPFR